jgi:hypothetical protein
VTRWRFTDTILRRAAESSFWRRWTQDECERATASEPRERSGAGTPASERVGWIRGATPPGDVDEGSDSGDR